MSFLQSLFSGVKALVKGFVSVAREAIRVVLVEIDNSSLGRAATDLVKGVTRQHFSKALDLVEEERELSEKKLRDGKHSSSDLDRLREIEAERDSLRRELEAAKKAKAAEELKNAAAEVVAVDLSADEAASAVGILSSKECPECGGTMRIMLGAYNANLNKQTFYWKCTVAHQIPCPTLKLDPEADRATVLREPDPDLDGSHAARRAIWTRPDVLASAHGRLRQGLGDDDEEVICPKHLLPMKLMPLPKAGGLMLDSYQYVCLGVNPDGRACDHAVPIKSFPQVSAALKRREGTGIITS